jgi:hypothetical protein
MPDCQKQWEKSLNSAINSRLKQTTAVEKITYLLGAVCGRGHRQYFGDTGLADQNDPGDPCGGDDGSDSSRYRAMTAFNELASYSILYLPIIPTTTPRRFFPNYDVHA